MLRSYIKNFDKRHLSVLCKVFILSPCYFMMRNDVSTIFEGTWHMLDRMQKCLRMQICGFVKQLVKRKRVDPRLSRVGTETAAWNREF